MQLYYQHKWKTEPNKQQHNEKPLK